MLNNLKTIKNIRPAKRLGRGIGTGKGQTSGRGTKGQRSRSGFNIPRRFEGGQTPLIARLPKAKGFASRNEKPVVINISVIERKFNDGETVNKKTLLEKDLIKDAGKSVKILGSKLTKSIKFRGVSLTKALLEASRKVKEEPKKELSEETPKKRTRKSTAKA